jgi:hypothetical protein
VAIERGEVAAQLAEVETAINPTQQVIGWNVISRLNE